MKVLLLLLLCIPAYGDEFTVRVVSVHDADTIVVLQNGHAETIRLKGIECPEAGEAKSLRAKKYASEALLHKNVVMKTYGKDKYGRTIADLFLQNGTLVQPGTRADWQLQVGPQPRDAELVVCNIRFVAPASGGQELRLRCPREGACTK